MIISVKLKAIFVYYFPIKYILVKHFINKRKKALLLICSFLFLLLILFLASKYKQSNVPVLPGIRKDTSFKKPAIDTLVYLNKLKLLANEDKTGKWPPVTATPLKGALLPYNRIVAYYGNFYNKNMGILGEYSSTIMLQKLNEQVKQWEDADSLTHVIPAIHYIAVTAQSSAGNGGYYRMRMPEKEIQKAINMADSINGITFLDVQVGLSTLQNELPQLEKYLIQSKVHLGIDPEFSMKSGKRPGTSIGTFDAEDINYATAWLAKIVKDHQLPPKILVVHRFTEGMLTNYKNIITRPEVQIVINMDGFGSPVLKKSTYQSYIYKQPIQFTGFKVFYKIDAKTGKRIMQPLELLQLTPKPIYIQYQ